MIRRNAPLTVAIGLLAVACLVLGSTQAFAEMSDREEKWQFYIPLTYSGGETFNSGPSSVDISSDLGWGFAFGYNFNERWMLGFEITWRSSSYEAAIATDDNGDGNPEVVDRFSSRLDSSSIQIVGQFNFLETMVTPFIRAGLGSTFMDSNIASGPPQGTCWWHPWWGYICGSWIPTYNTSEFSYQAGLGVRADITDTFFLELSYNQMWIDFREATPSFNNGRLNIGWLF